MSEATSVVGGAASVPSEAGPQSFNDFPITEELREALVAMGYEQPTDVQSAVLEQKIARPRAVWTGAGVQLVWLEYSVEEGGPDIEGANLDGARSFSLRTAPLDVKTGTVGDPVDLPGAGSGPASLTGLELDGPRTSLTLPAEVASGNGLRDELVADLRRGSQLVLTEALASTRSVEQVRASVSR